MFEQQARQESQKGPVQRRGSVTFDLGGFNILLADDYDFMQNLVEAMLKEFGIGSILTGRDGMEARDFLTLSLAAQQSTDLNSVDILLTDWMMPGGSGLDLIRWIRNHKKDEIRFLPIILITAFASQDVIIAARDAGANEALVKPVSGELLASRILNVINHPRPFIKASDFFGPDRRRRDKKFAGEDRRLTPAEEITKHYEQPEEAKKDQLEVSDGEGES
jgi:two-component system, chemotaxis family, chemotaxis protein CheY